MIKNGYNKIFHKFIINKGVATASFLLLSCIFSVFSLIYIYGNNRYGTQSVNCYFSYNSNKLRQDVPLRERGSGFSDPPIVLAFFNGVNMSNPSHSVQDYYFTNVIHGLNNDISISFEKIAALTRAVTNANEDDKETLNIIIQDIALNMQSKLHEAESIHLTEIKNLTVMRCNDV